MYRYINCKKVNRIYLIILIFFANSSLQEVADTIRAATSAGVSVDLEATAQGLGFGSFAEYAGYKLDSFVTKFVPTMPTSDYAISKSLAFLPNLFIFFKIFDFNVSPYLIVFL